MRSPRPPTNYWRGYKVTHGSVTIWKGASDNNQRKARQLIVDFMAEAAGGPAYYTGRDMKTSHVGMHIDERDWDAFMRHAAATLDHFGVPVREKDEVLAFFASLKAEIVES